MHSSASVAHVTFDSSLAPSIAWDAPVSAEEMERLKELNESNGNCVRGAFVALGIEAVMVLMVCGLWQAWHFVR
jgi:hypothetical protein